MTLSLFVIQLLNGLQLGVLLFMLSAGLTLVFGIMNFVNLAHGSLYMMGAYFAALAYGKTSRSGLPGWWRCPVVPCWGFWSSGWWRRASTHVTTWTRCWPPSV